MIVDLKSDNSPIYYNPRKATFFQKIILLFKKTKKSVDESESYVAKTYYKTLKDCIYVIAIDLKRK